MQHRRDTREYKGRSRQRLMLKDKGLNSRSAGCSSVHFDALLLKGITPHPSAEVTAMKMLPPASALLPAATDATRQSERSTAYTRGHRCRHTAAVRHGSTRGITKHTK